MTLGVTVGTLGRVIASDATTGNVAITSAAGIDVLGTISAAGAVAGGSVLLTAETTIGQNAAGLIETTKAATDNANVVLSAKQGITLAGTITSAATTPAAGSESVRIVSSAGAITQTGGTIQATDATSGLMLLQANTSISTAGTVTAAGALAGSPAVSLIAQTGTIGQTAGLLAATNAAGRVSVSAQQGITLAGTVAAAGTSPAAGSESVRIVSTVGAISQTGGTIQATNATSGLVLLQANTNLSTAGTVTAAGDLAGSPAVSLIAQTGTIGQTAGLLAATNAAGRVSVLADQGITLAGTVTAAGTSPAAGSESVRIISTSGAISQTGGTIQATNATSGLVLLQASTNIDTAGTVTAAGDLAGSPAVSLIAQTGTIGQSTGTIAATNATGSVVMLADGDINLGGLVRAISAGTAADPSIGITSTNGSITQTPTTATIIATNDAGFIALNAANGDIAFAGTISAGGAGVTPLGTVAVNAGGDFTEIVSGTTTGVLITGLLTGVVEDNIHLLTPSVGAGNQIARIGALTANKGDIQIRDSLPLTIEGGAANRVQATEGNVYLQSTGGAIIFGNDGTIIAAAANKTVGLHADAVQNLGTAGVTGTVTTNTGTFELAPFTVGNAVTLGAGAGLVLETLTGITADRVRIGAVTPPGAATATITAGTIDIAGFNATTTKVLELNAVAGGAGSGDVGQSGVLILTGGTLVGEAQSFTLANAGNDIAVLGTTGAGPLGSLRAVQGLTIAADSNLTIAGDVVSGTGGTAGDLSINVGTKALVVHGEAAAAGTSGNVSLSGGAITLEAFGGILPVVAAREAGTVAITATGALVQTDGIINAGGVTLQAASVALSKGAVIANNGSIGVTANAGAGAIDITGTGTIATVNAAGTNVLLTGAVKVADSARVSAIGGVTVNGPLTQSGGAIASGGAMTLAGGFTASAGSILSGAGLLIGQPISAVAGDPGSAGSTNAFNQTGGTISSAGAIDIFASTLSQSGVIVTSSRLGVTAGADITVQGTLSAGSVSRAGTTNQGFMLLSTGGNLTVRGAGLLAGPTGLATGNTVAGNALQAPSGTVLIDATTANQPFVQSLAFTPGSVSSSAYTLVSPARTVPLGTLGTLPSLGLSSTAPVIGAAVTSDSPVIPAVLVGSSVSIQRAVAATTLGLYAKSAIDQGAAAPITTSLLTGSAGVVSDGVLVTGLTSLGWTNAAAIGWVTNVGGVIDTLGTVDLTKASNSIATLSDFRVTQDFKLRNGQDLTTTGSVQSGLALSDTYIKLGTPAPVANTTSLAVTGKLTVTGTIATGRDDGAIRPGGNTTLTATTIDLSTGGVVAAVKSSAQGGQATLAATGAITQSGNALLNAGTIDLTAPGGFTLNTGRVVATEGTIGIHAEATINSGGTMAAVNNATNIIFDGNVSQTDVSYVGANGNVTVTNLLTQTGGTVLAVENVTLGGYSGGGIVGAGQGLSVGAGTGTAGKAGSVATAGSFNQTGGTLAANGAVNVFTTGQFMQTGGTLAAGGTLGVTAATNIDVAGTVSASGATGFMLLASAGNVDLRTTGILAGPDLAVTTKSVTAGGATFTGLSIDGNAVQAPAGTVTITGASGTTAFRDQAAVVVSTTKSTGYTITPPGPSVVTALTNPSVTFGTAAERPAVIVGKAIAANRPIGATFLGLYAQDAITQTAAGIITAGTLTGSAGILRPLQATETGTLEVAANLAPGLQNLGWTTGNIGWQQATTDTLGSVDLTTATNQVGILSDFRATQDFGLNNGKDLIQTGTVQAGSALSSSYASVTAANTLTIGVTGNLTVNGVVAAGIDNASTFTPPGTSSAKVRPGGNLSLTANAITIAAGSSPILPVLAAAPGSQPGSGTVTLNAGGGALTQTAGVINGGTISVTAATATFSDSRVVATQGSLGVTANTTINNGATIAMVNGTNDITFTGAVTQNAASYVGSNKDITVTGLLTENGGTMLAVGAIGLGSLNLTSGTVGAGTNLAIGSGTGTTGFAGSTATAGSFSQSGGRLSARGNANVFTLGAFSQTGGEFLANGTLGVTASLDILVNSTIAASSGTGFMLLAGANATLGTAGLLAGPTSVTTGGNAFQANNGTVTIAGTTGTTGFGQAGGVDPITAVSGYTLVCGDCLLLPGTVLPSVPTLASTVTSPTPSVASVAGGGVLSAPTGLISATLVGQTIDIQRTLVASTLGLYARDRITEGASGAINANTITGTAGLLAGASLVPGLSALTWTTGNIGWGTAAGSVSLTGANAVTTLADFHATQNFTFNNTPFGAARTLTQTGTLQAGSATSASYGGGVPSGTTLAITNQGTLSVTGRVADGIGDGVARPLGTVALTATNFTAGGAVGQPGSIDISGIVSANGATDTTAPNGTLALNASGRITEGGGTSVGAGVGTIIAGVLTGSSGTTTTLDNIANRVGTIQNFSATDNLTLRNGTGTLTVAGTVQTNGAGGALVLRNGTTGGTNNLILAPNSTTRADNVTLLAPGTISNNGDVSATIMTNLLTLPNAATAGAGVGSATNIVLADPNTANLTGVNPTSFVNNIGTIGPVVVSGSLVVTNNQPLTLAGNISAPAIRIGAKTRLTLANGLVIATGAGAPITLPAQSSAPPDRAASSGLNLAIIGGAGTIDLGPNLTIMPTAGVSEPVLRLALTSDGTVRFGNLNAATTNVLLHVGKGTATSVGGTNIKVGNLFVSYTQTPSASMSLSGTVGGQSASGAATISRIGVEANTIAFPNKDVAGVLFEPSALFQVNQCSITSVNCVLTSTLQIPPQLPLQTLYLPLPLNVLDDPDLLLPFISDQDD